MDSSNPSTPGDLVPGDIIQITGWSNGDKYAHPMKIGAKHTMAEVEADEWKETGVYVGNLEMHRQFGDPLFIVRRFGKFIVAYNFFVGGIQLIDISDVQVALMDIKDARCLTSTSNMDAFVAYLGERDAVEAKIRELIAVVRTPRRTKPS